MSLLDNYTWKSPKRTTNVGGPPEIRFFWWIKTKAEGDVYASRFELKISSSAVKEMEIDEEVNTAAISFDNPGELILVIDPPRTIPSYQLRNVSNQVARMITNKDLVRLGVQHLGFSLTEKGYLHLDFEYLGDDQGVKFWKLTPKQDGFIDES